VHAGDPGRARGALAGPNGAGKTTLLNLAVGLAAPTLSLDWLFCQVLG